jgi:proline iminopeptidase
MLHILSSRPAKIAAALGIAGTYAFGLRPRILRWGATQKEIDREFPGADIIPGAKRGATMAVTIDAPPRTVWQYLVQMGVDRGGWYSWDKLDNWGIASTDHVHPEWQDIKVGDHFIAKPDGGQWWEVAALEPEHFLCLRASVDLHMRPFDPHSAKPRHYSDSTWGFLLEKLPGERTRLIVSGYWDLQPRWLKPASNFFILEPSHWIMQMRQFANLKRFAERDEREAKNQRVA